MTKHKLRQVCQVAEKLTKKWKRSFPGLDHFEIFHLFRGVLSTPTENFRQMVEEARFFEKYQIHPPSKKK